MMSNVATSLVLGITEMAERNSQFPIIFIPAHLNHERVLHSMMGRLIDVSDGEASLEPLVYKFTYPTFTAGGASTTRSAFLLMRDNNFPISADAVYEVLVSHGLDSDSKEFLSRIVSRERFFSRPATFIAGESQSQGKKVPWRGGQNGD